MSENRRQTGVVELCEYCGRETEHEVSIEIVTESQKETNAEFSKEPYRISTCRACGNSTRLRMNNA
ncbi:DUF7835 family putative zinc beta-ribbon protein [Halegenticoccus tardaugens]|uniref:DUF7835 family putative zinc beta-ribbon protein n=1 Tax=Halegenticoccus tardaugens TaxID=2071624 RepID=UPI00100B97B1|nr:hypothetical protein [Halegenticoccus tardaugens]